jgi:hypothetical protein
MDLGRPQTIFMSHTYLQFEFGTDEEKAQEACHKLDIWKQTARLDKKLLYKLEREEDSGAESSAEPEKAGKAEKTETAEKAAQSEKGKSKGKAKSSAGQIEKAATAGAKTEKTAAPAANLTLIVRLYFSSHEKLSEQRWMDRIPSEEPFKSASPKIIRKGDAEFEQADEQFTDQELGSKRAR